MQVKPVQKKVEEVVKTVTPTREKTILITIAEDINEEQRDGSGRKSLLEDAEKEDVYENLMLKSKQSSIGGDLMLTERDSVAINEEKELLMK